MQSARGKTAAGTSGKPAHRPDKALRFILELLRAGIGLAEMDRLTVAGAAPDWSNDVTGLPV